MTLPQAKTFAELFAQPNGDCIPSPDGGPNRFPDTGDVVRATLAARQRTGNTGISTKGMNGRIQVLQATPGLRVRPLSSRLSPADAIAFLDNLR